MSNPLGLPAFPDSIPSSRLGRRTIRCCPIYALIGTCPRGSNCSYLHWMGSNVFFYLNLDPGLRSRRSAAPNVNAAEEPQSIIKSTRGPSELQAAEMPVADEPEASPSLIKRQNLKRRTHSPSPSASRTAKREKIEESNSDLEFVDDDSDVEIVVSTGIA
jgi:hypothetical protein